MHIIGLSVACVVRVCVWKTDISANNNVQNTFRTIPNHYIIKSRFVSSFTCAISSIGIDIYDFPGRILLACDSLYVDDFFLSSFYLYKNSIEKKSTTNSYLFQRRKCCIDVYHKLEQTTLAAAAAAETKREKKSEIKICIEICNM